MFISKITILIYCRNHQISLPLIIIKCKKREKLKALKTINITHGIAVKKLINLLQKYEVLLLNRKKKTYKIQQDFIQIFQNHTLTLDQIPTQFKNIELSDLQKSVLIKNDSISLSLLKIR